MPDVAKEVGAFIIATGRSDFCNQLNNSLVFPGVFKGVLEADIKQFEVGMFSAIAQALADSVVDLGRDKILPTMFEAGVVKVVSETIKEWR
jgi:malate dehydrogenase (oxaloacetate-decarboxylating)